MWSEWSLGCSRMGSGQTGDGGQRKSQLRLKPDSSSALGPSLSGLLPSPLHPARLPLAPSFPREAQEPIFLRPEGPAQGVCP